MQLRGGSRWSLAAAIPLAAVLLYWSARGVNWRDLWDVVSRAQPGFLCGAAAISSMTLFLRAMRWRILLNAEAQLGMPTVFRANMVGYLGNNFLPARAGELLRSLLVSRVSELSNTYVLTTALGERLMDVIAVVLAGALALLGVNPVPTWAKGLQRGMLTAAIAGALLVTVLPHTGTLIQRVCLRLPLPERARAFLKNTAGQVLLGLRAFHDWGRLSGFAALTVLIWVGDGVGLIVGARALQLAIPFPGAILLLTAMALGSALPSTPGYLGIYQFAAVMVLVPFGIGRAEALAYSVVMQALSFGVVAAFGLPALYASRDSLSAASRNECTP